MNKEELINNFLTRLVDSYGYSAEQICTDFVVGDGVTIDIAIWRDFQSRRNQHMPDVCVAIVCNPEYVRIEAADYFKNLLSVPMQTHHFLVANNLKETKVFYHNTIRPDSMVHIPDFPKAEDCADEAKLEKFITKMVGANKDALFDAFTKCHNIIRNNDKLSPEAAFDEISKVIFIKMRYERSNPDGELLYSAEKFAKDDAKSKDPDYINTLYKQVISDYKSVRLFEEQDRIRIKRESFVKILNELEIADFNYTDVDVKGVAFEAFLGKTFRGELGQFFTPRTIVNYMIEVLNPKEGDKICDPCCGSGGFLIKAFEYIQEKIEKDIDAQIKAVQASALSNDEKNRKIEVLLGELDKKKKGSRMWKLCNEYLYGVDANPRMARTSKMNMIMHGDGHVGIVQHDGLTDVPGLIVEGMFDMVLINPPYGVRIDRDMIGEDTDKKIDKLYDLKQTAAEALFIERTLRLLKSGGVAGLVLPDGVMTGSTYERVRAYTEEHAEIMNLSSIPADVFLASGANVKPSILFLRKKLGSFGAESRLSIVKVDDAGINSLGQPTDNAQLKACAPKVNEWVEDKRLEEDDLVRVIYRGDMDRWNIAPFFQTKKVRFNSKYQSVQLSDILNTAWDEVLIQDNEEYRRVTVKLFNKGLYERDRVKGFEIGTKRQNRVHTGQFVISKIDGKSGAFGYVPEELDGAIVTSDFLVLDVNTNVVNPDYLELVLASPAILDQYKVESSGSTGRKRLQLSTLMHTIVPLPSMEVQLAMVDVITQLRKKQKEVEERLEKEVVEFRNHLFE